MTPRRLPARLAAHVAQAAAMRSLACLDSLLQARDEACSAAVPDCMRGEQGRAQGPTRCCG